MNTRNLGVSMTNTEIFHIFHIFSLFNLLSFHIFQIFSLFNLLFFRIFQIFSLFNLPFFCIFHIFSLFNLLFLHIFHIFSRFNLLLPLYMYIHCFSELRRIILDYASRDKIYHFIHLALRNTTVRTRTPLEYYTTISNISENNKLLCNYWRC
jgi:hypothetical protein